MINVKSFFLCFLSKDRKMEVISHGHRNSIVMDVIMRNCKHVLFISTEIFATTKSQPVGMKLVKT